MNRVDNMSPPWSVPLVVLKWGMWYPFWQVKTSSWFQNTSISLHMWWLTPYPSKVVSRRPRSTVLCAIQRSRNTSKRVSWSTLAKSYTRFSSNMAVPITLPAQTPCRMSWSQTLSLRRVSMIASITFHINSNKKISWKFVLSLGIRTSIVHHSSLKGLSVLTHELGYLH